MLIQLSPWETSSTSIRVPKSSSRRRKRDTTKDDEPCPSFAASMITMTSRRSLSSMKLHSSEFSDCLPLMTITADHHITVIGKNIICDESPSYREFSNLRYNSRPGEAGSFFAKPENGKFSPNDLPRIPAILDTKNDRVYALQHGNNRLTCWHSWKGNGPDEKAALKVELKYPALSITLLPMNKGIVYGSCQNGIIYVARVITDSSKVPGDTRTSLSVEYLLANSQIDRKGEVNIGTFAELDFEQGKVSGKKRKTSDADGNSSVIFYQVFCDGTSIKIVRNNVKLSISNADRLVKNGSLVQNVASINLLNEELSDVVSQYRLTNVKLLVSSYGSAPKISVVYTVERILNNEIYNEFHNQHLGTFCAAISLVSGGICHSAVKLLSQSKQFGLITETVLAAASNDIIYLYDLITGSMLQSISLKHIICDMDGGWVLYTNVKHGVLIVFYPKEDHLHVAFSTATLDETKGSLGSKKLKSSSKLACSLLAYEKGDFQSVTEKFDMIHSTVINKDADGSSAFIRLDESVSKALKALDENRRMIISRCDESTLDTSFRDTFNASVSSLMKDIDNSKDASTINNDNEELPSWLPQSFIDGSVQIVMAAILTEKQDEKTQVVLSKLGREARCVLKILLQSKRVSARLHFEGSYSLQETGKKHPLVTALKLSEHLAKENPLSALQMILELIVNCSDISERQLVVILNYMMRYAKPDDIIETLTYSKNIRNQQLHVLKELTSGNNAIRKKIINLKSTNVPVEVIQEENAGRQKKIVVAGVMLVLQMVVDYSECNEAMLRVALAEELSSSSEAMILARLLPNLLLPDPCKNPLRQIKRQNSVKSACQWIAALSESFRDELRFAMISPEDTYLSFLLNSVTKATKNSEAIMSLKDCIGAAEMMKKYKELNERKDASETPQIEDLMGYSIDRIIF